MRIRRFIIAVLLCAFPCGVVPAGEPVVTSEPVVTAAFRTISLLGQHCLTVLKNEPRLRPGTRLDMRGCENSPEQIFDWNVVTFEIKFQGLCVDALRAGEDSSQPGDPVGLWYCQQNPHQKWYPNNNAERWADAFNIVGGGSPSSTLCLSIAGDKAIDGAQLTLQTCNGTDHQWLRLDSWSPPDGQSLAQAPGSTADERD